MKVREIEIPDNRPFIVRASEYKPADNFNPPNTLGKPRGEGVEAKRVMAMDACIKNVLSGFQSELYNAGTPMFAGYGLLSSISQEALIRAGVETIADEMTRKFVTFRYDVDDGRENHEQEISALEEEAAKFKLKEIFNDAAQKDGYFGGCLVYIDVGELDDEEALEPLTLDKKTFKKGMLKGFKVIEPINIYPGEYNTTDPTDEHYFNPEYWYVLGKRYHASRFLYFVSNSVPVLLKPAYNFFGIARAQLALDYIAHFVENRESAQELLNKFSLTCWKTDMSQVLAGESCNDLVKRVRMFNKMKSNNGTLVVDKEQEDIMQINTPLAGVRDIVDMSLSLLTAVWRIPKIKYIGEGEGGLNASSKEQMRSFYDFILSQKEKMFTQPMETVLKLLQLNMGKDINESIGFEFPSLVEMDDAEIANLNKLKADTAVQLINAGVVSQEEVRQNLSMDKHSGFSMIDVDDMPEQPEQPNEKEVVEVEDEDLAYDSFEGHAGRIGQVGGSLPRGSSIKLLDGVSKYDIEAAKDYVGHSKLFKEDAIGWDDKKIVKKIDNVLSNPVLDGFWANVSKEEEVKKKKEVLDHIKKNEYIATPETLMFYLYDGFDGQTTVKDFMKKYDVYDEEYIKQMLNGLAINYPDYIHYTDTLGLDTITLKKSKAEKRDYYTINIVDENGDLFDQKTVLASKNEIKEKYGNKVSSIKKESKKSRIDAAESIVGDEDLVMDERWITIKNNHDNPEEKGRHLLLEGEGENQETPAEAMKRQWKVDITKKDNKKEEGSSSGGEGKNEKTEQKLEKEGEKDEERSKKIKSILDNADFGKIKKETADKIKSSLAENFKEFDGVSDVLLNVGSIQAMSRKDQKEALEINKEQIESTIKSTEERYFKMYTESELIRSFGSIEAFKKKVRNTVEKRIKKSAATRAGGETAHFSWNTLYKKGAMRFNENVINDGTFSLRQDMCEANGYHPKNCVGIKSTTDHEFGHAIERYILEKKPDSLAYKKLNELYNSLTKEEIGATLSRYGATNFSEFIAEGYCEYRNNKPPRDVAGLIGALLTKAYMEAKNG